MKGSCRGEEVAIDRAAQTGLGFVESAECDRQLLDIAADEPERAPIVVSQRTDFAPQ